MYYYLADASKIKNTMPRQVSSRSDISVCMSAVSCPISLAICLSMYLVLHWSSSLVVQGSLKEITSDITCFDPWCKNSDQSFNEITYSAFFLSFFAGEVFLGYSERYSRYIKTILRVISWAVRWVLSRFSWWSRPRMGGRSWKASPWNPQLATSYRRSLNSHRFLVDRRSSCTATLPSPWIWQTRGSGWFPAFQVGGHGDRWRGRSWERGTASK